MAHLRTMLALALSCSTLTHAGAAMAQERRPLNGYAIQIHHKGVPFSQNAMKGPELKGKTGFTLPPEMMVGRAGKDGGQVSLVWVAAHFEGEAWRIKVSVVRGEFYDGGEQEVATHSVRENERVKISEVSEFGIDPFEVSIVRVVQAAAAQPAVRNKTESIEVLGVEAGLIPSPYRLTLSNRSHKRVLALEVRTYSGERMVLLKWPEGTWDRPLMEAGGTCEVEIPSAGGGQTTSYGYVPEQSTSVEVTTVVFEDGTHEGEPYLAAVTRAEMAGSRTQLERVVPLLRTAWEAADDGGVKNVLAGLKEDVSRLGEDAGAAQLKELRNRYPTLSDGAKQNLANFMRSGLHKVKTTVLKDIEAFQRGARPAGGGAAGELLKTRERYEKWLAALSL